MSELAGTARPNLHAARIAAPRAWRFLDHLGGNCAFTNDIHSTPELWKGYPVATSGGQHACGPWIYCDLLARLVCLHQAGG